MSAEVALQKAIVAALRADAGLLALTGNRKAGTAEARVFDRVEPDTALPYVNIGEIQAVDDGAECLDGIEVFVTIHVWSGKVGAIEARRMIAAVRDALHEQAITLEEPYALLEIQHRDSRTFPDADPSITHGVLTIRALIERV